MPDSLRGQRNWLFSGRAGNGREVNVYGAGPWLDIQYEDSDGLARGFSLNPMFGQRLALALVQHYLSDLNLNGATASTPIDAQGDACAAGGSPTTSSHAAPKAER